MQATTFRETFPVIFTDRAVSGAALRAACSAARSALVSHGLEVHCPAIEPSAFVMHTVAETGNNNTNTTNVYVWQFNLFLWIPIVFVAVLIVVLWSFTTASNDRDTILYRSTRHKGD